MNLYVKRYKSLNELLNYDRLRMFADAVKDPITEKVEEYLRVLYLKNREFKPVELSGHGSFVNSVAFSPDGKTLASGSGDKTIKLWNVGVKKDSEDFGKEIKTLRGHGDTVYSVAFSPDGKTLASGSRDSTIRLWNVGVKKDSEDFGKNIKTLTGHGSSVWSVAFSPDGKTLASGSHDKTIRLWNVEKGNKDFGKEIKTLTGHGIVISVTFSPDGKTLASGSGDKTIRLWNVEKGNKDFGKEIKTLSGHGHWVYSVAFSPDGKTLAFGSGDKTIKLWTLFEDEDFKALNNIKNLFFKQVLVLYFKINQHKKNGPLTLDGEAKAVWQGVEKDVQGLVNKTLK